MRSVVAAVLVPVLVVFLIGPYTLFLPSLLEYAVARDVKARLGVEKQPHVELKSDSPLGMLAGEFSGGRIVMKNTDLGNVTATRARIDLDPFDINVWATMREGHVVDRDPRSGDVRVDVPESEVSRLAKAQSEIPINDVDVHQDRVVVGSEVSVLGRRFPATIEGDLGLRDGELVFEPQGLTAAGVRVPDELADRLLAGTSIEYPLDRLPYQTTITSVEADEGRIILSGRVPSVPLGAYPGG
jgi:LmeA-like phospholipid-binding